MSLIVLCGYSGSGKTTIANVLQEKYGYHRIITYTTRPKREQEVNGKDYHFISEEEFKQMIHQDFFFEWTYFNDAYYGSLKRAYQPEKAVVFLDPTGVKKIVEMDPDCMVFELCISKELAIKRLKQRKENIEKRRCKDEEAFAQLNSLRNRIILIPIEENDTVEDVVKKIKKKRIIKV